MEQVQGRFQVVGNRIGQLVDQKDKAYGEAITTVEGILCILYPNGISLDQFKDALIIVRILDKFSRIAKGDIRAFGENPWADCAGYSLQGVARYEADDKA
ncbi:hypothetical protein EV210_101168 [Anaerospora hongkongensis]|uniref:Uncharacterized protein n=1 Tax=Anaerospora hongkongensis TaxID=244830 RepID=A0A4R1Q201_9FIRM|nr:hypothetical protein [Anaerospora hongkongensis]TCL39970.1 hypothetical protein EV210_101168 [Anaerospora hongkongensis]